MYTANCIRSMMQVLFFENLFIVFLLTFFGWYLQYHWNRRKLYSAAWKRHGPFPLPFIGNALRFVGSHSAMLYNVLSLTNSYESPVPIWIGSKLIFGVYEAKDLETIMNSPHALKKDDLYKFAEPLVGTGLFTAPVAKWKRHRKIIMPTFNQKNLDNFVPVFAEQSNVLVEQLRKEIGKEEFDIFRYVSRCSLDIICETAMSTKVMAQTTDSEVMKWITRAMEIGFMRMFNIFYHSDFIFNLTSYSKELYDVVGRIHRFTESVVKEKRQAYENSRAPLAESGGRGQTFLEELIELAERGDRFTDEELREEVNTVMVAGSDTTASMDSFVFLMLGMHPDIQEKVYQEVVSVLGTDRAVLPTDLTKFKYLDRVIRETLRIFPLGFIAVRAVTQDINLEKCTIPAGSSVAMAIIALHRDPSVYPDPLKFEPDRFLPEEVAKRHPYSWLPFSGGPRSCLGPKYAFMAMKTVIATVVRKYKFVSKFRRIEDIRLKVDLMIKPVDGHKVSITLRQ